jgi:AraC family transcriptional regulator
MKPEIRTLPEMKIVYVVRTGMVNGSFTKAADQAYLSLNNFFETGNLWSNIRGCVGVCPDDPQEIPQNQARYLGAYILDGDSQIHPTGEVQLGILPGGKYAVFMHRGSYDSLTDTWTAVLKDWLPTSGEKLRKSDPFEIYLDDKTKIPPQDLRTEIYIPIE